MSDKINVCPECDSCNVRARSSHTTHTETHEHDWACVDCGVKFDSPARREPKNPLGEDDPTAPAPHHLAGRLWEMDPDDIGRSA